MIIEPGPKRILPKFPVLTMMELFPKLSPVAGIVTIILVAVAKTIRAGTVLVVLFHNPSVIKTVLLVGSKFVPTIVISLPCLANTGVMNEIDGFVVAVPLTVTVVAELVPEAVLTIRGRAPVTPVAGILTISCVPVQPHTVA